MSTVNPAAAPVIGWLTPISDLTEMEGKYGGKTFEELAHEVGETTYSGEFLPVQIQ